MEKGETFVLLVEMQTGAATVESSMEVTQKIKNRSAFWPSDLTSGNILEGTQNTNLKEHKHLCVHCSIIYNHQDMEAAQVSSGRWVDKTTMGHLHNRILLSHKKKNNKKILPFMMVWMDMENITLSEIRQAEKYKYLWFHSYVESNEQTELTSKTETDSYGEQDDS